ncbi:MAG: hypothetical protein AAF702_06700 [Chloroflexota bacterium]
MPEQNSDENGTQSSQNHRVMKRSIVPTLIRLLYGDSPIGADTILVMDKGEIIEPGRHHELMARSLFLLSGSYVMTRDFTYFLVKALKI